VSELDVRLECRSGLIPEMSILFQAHGGGSAEQIDLGEDADDADHMITAEEGLRVAMARQ